MIKMSTFCLQKLAKLIRQGGIIRKSIQDIL